MSSILRNAVSKQKRRYQKNGYDLDLAYITDKVIAMGFPSEKVEGVFRNPMKEVQKFLDHYHKDHYKVYNLCSERDYDHSKFYGRVGVFPFDDHNAPQFELIEAFCKDVESYMKEDEKNIVVVHCKAGKGRTGLMICCWLLYCKMWEKTEDSLRFYAALRTYNQKGVTIPSQIRYVHYFGDAVRGAIKYTPRTVLLRKILLQPLPKDTNLSEITFNICVGKTQVYHSKDSLNVTIHKVEKKKKSKKEKKDKKDSKSQLEHSQSVQQLNGSSSTNGNGTVSNGTMSQRDLNTLRSQSTIGFDQSYDNQENEEYISFDIGSLPLLGDVRIEFCDKAERMFMFWVNTSFVQQHEIIGKSGLDKAHKDKNHKSYPKDFRVEMFFEKLEPSQTTVVASADEQSPVAIHQNGSTSSQDNIITPNSVVVVTTPTIAVASTAVETSTLSNDSSTTTPLPSSTTIEAVVVVKTDEKETNNNNNSSNNNNNSNSSSSSSDDETTSESEQKPTQPSSSSSSSD
ncbi:hypothetical protein CYY_001411 [Polysphondylium violaceum]|uniref:Phosphatidylinositol 3,4,5-trisphosphate 3-phosphatase and dual-specificity protein phosphatase PTEN n=1 Tax=Polysphondylium violaceum TaxID=133409 RepID=A0A8J4Q057_9MYCE|nr:hypothetical protein CYY_001411 [Polysphondylium violaceum]